jgi:hypothetical protein
MRFAKGHHQGEKTNADYFWKTRRILRRIAPSRTVNAPEVVGEYEFYQMELREAF